MKAKLYAWWLWALSFIPVDLPTSPEAFQTFCTRLFTAYGFEDSEGYRALVANFIMHVDAPKFQKAPRFFAGVVKNSMSKHVAYAVIQAERDALKAAAAQAKAADVQPVSNT